MIQIKDIFDIQYGEFSTPIQQLNGGSVPLVTSGSKNNGVVGFFDLEPLYKNVISVARTGSIGETFYHDYPCVINSDCMVLTAKQSLSVEDMFWFVYAIGKSKIRFSYARKVTPSRLGQIFIPSEKPKWFKKADWNLESKLNKKATDKEINLDVSTWQWFTYNVIFDLKKGQRIVNNEMIKGNTPCIRPIEDNNGVHDYIDLEPNHTGNTITVNYNGSVAEAFYQPKPYFALDDINILYPKFELNPYIAMFLITLIRKEKYRFSYGRKWHLGRMKESKIKLPIDSNGKPDWKFMEDYIKSLPYSANI